MPEKLTQALCPTSSCSAADFHARLSALPVHAKDSEIQEALSSLNLPAWLKPGTLRIQTVYNGCKDAGISEKPLFAAEKACRKEFQKASVRLAPERKHKEPER